MLTAEILLEATTVPVMLVTKEMDSHAVVPDYVIYAVNTRSYNVCKKASNRCDINARCQNSPGSYNYMCHAGF